MPMHQDPLLVFLCEACRRKFELISVPQIWYREIRNYRFGNSDFRYRKLDNLDISEIILLKVLIPSVPYAVLSLFATRFAACAGGHLGRFYRAISHLKWCQMVCLGDSTRKFSRIKSTNMFFTYFQSGVPRDIISIHCGFNHAPAFYRAHWLVKVTRHV